MDARLLSDKSINRVNRIFRITGVGLFYTLMVALGVISLVLDWQTGRLTNLDGSLFLPFVGSTVITIILGYWVIPQLQSLKAGQVIREDGPQSHLQKAGTPTMGGIFVLPVAVILGLVLTGFNAQVLAVSFLILFYGFIGWLDDWQILRRQSNQGISPQQKLLLQLAGAVLFCFWMVLTQTGEIRNINLPGGWVIPLGALFWVLAGFVMIAESNATNLTDGLDGLAAGTGAIALLGLAASIAPTHPHLMVLSACLSGSYLGFLAHNHHPARVFMGDTGSLALGGGLAAIALLTNTLWVLALVGILFIVENLSVVAQVGYYKLTKGADGKGKRLLKMAPIHHHLELSGWTEIQVVSLFYLITTIMMGVCIVIVG
ncbi:MAG: phospho-N-acetylmuramoyl-pentapeptide-transferase [Cyanobacteria bacterium WB6_1B_304]|nr:phospho-N-acetylmuramoyl-pentapeptide-transferase [Cyanobacteria bacterium WB6_1B_304]